MYPIVFLMLCALVNETAGKAGGTAMSMLASATSTVEESKSSADLLGTISFDIAIRSDNEYLRRDTEGWLFINNALIGKLPIRGDVRVADGDYTLRLILFLSSWRLSTYEPFPDNGCFFQSVTWSIKADPGSPAPATLVIHRGDASLSLRDLQTGRMLDLGYRLPDIRYHRNGLRYQKIAEQATSDSPQSFPTGKYDIATSDVILCRDAPYTAYSYQPASPAVLHSITADIQTSSASIPTRWSSFTKSPDWKALTTAEEQISLSPPSHRRILVQLSPSLGGPRELDVDQLQHLKNWFIGSFDEQVKRDVEEDYDWSVVMHQQRLEHQLKPLSQQVKSWRGYVANVFDSIISKVERAPAETARTQYHVVEVRRYNESVEKTYGEGNSAFGRKDFSGAISKYSEAIQLNPTYTPAYVARGNAYLALMDYVQALANYNAALGVDPTDSDAYFARGTLHWFLGELDVAESEYRSAVRYDSDNSYYYSRLASVLYDLKKDSDVYALYDAAYRQDPQREWALWGWLGGLAAKKDYESLLATCKALMSNGNHTVPVRFYTGLAYLQLKRFTDSARELEAAIAVDPNTISLDTFLYLAEAYRGAGESGKCKTAIQQYSERVARVPNDKSLQWCDERN